VTRRAVGGDHVGVSDWKDLIEAGKGGRKRGEISLTGKGGKGQVASLERLLESSQKLDLNGLEGPEERNCKSTPVRRSQLEKKVLSQRGQKWVIGGTWLLPTTQAPEELPGGKETVREGADVCPSPSFRYDPGLSVNRRESSDFGGGELG